MKHIPLTDIKSCIQTFGRTYFDAQEGVLYSNYTCGGFQILFTGSVLVVNFAAIPDTFVPPGAATVPGMDIPKREDWPFISIFLDDSKVPYRKMRVKDGEPVMIFFSEKPETHRIKIVKLTENFRTALGIRSFETDGEIQPFSPEKKEIIEFIGDSIICGFGNDTRDISHEFEASEEDGWMTHGAIAARMLNLEPRFISVSGISIHNAMPMPGFYAMEELYPYADRIMETKIAQQRGQEVTECQLYDFMEKPAKYVVLNLGTNDANQIYFAPEETKPQAELAFEESYYRFVSEIRRLNGPDTTIICALGCMDYYLFDKICMVVDRIKKETKDEKIFTLKYNKMMNVGPDAGGCLHPSIHRHKEMAQDLVNKIRLLQGKENDQ